MQQQSENQRQRHSFLLCLRRMQHLPRSSHVPTDDTIVVTEQHPLIRSYILCACMLSAAGPVLQLLRSCQHSTGKNL